MKKVLFFASDFQIGLSSLLTDELLAFHQAGIEVLAVAGEREQEEGLSERIMIVPTVFRINGLDGHHHFRLLANKIAEIIKSSGTTVIHVQNNWQLALVAYAKYIILHNRHLRIIYTLHGFRNNHPLKSVIARLMIGTALLCFADYIICTSSYLKRKFSLLSYKIKLLPLGIPDCFFTITHDLPTDRGLQMIFPAQFRYGKNQDVIIKAFAQHIKETGDSISHLTLPGSGELLEQMKTLANELGIADRVSFPGQCTKEQIRQQYLQSNIGIVASNSETFGQSIVEPFVLGRCILTTPVGIAPDIIHEGEGGGYFRTAEELTQKMKLLFNTPSIIAQCGENNYKHKELFRWASISRQYKSLLTK